jgi:hypothetical protein
MPIKVCLKPTFESVRWLIVAALLAAGMQAVIAARAYSINVDGLTFIAIAEQLEQDPVATIRKHDQHPGYPAMILCAERTLEAFGRPRDPWTWTVATRMPAAICGVLSVIAMWLFTRRMFGVQVANIAALSFAALPLFRMNASDALSDTPHLLFYLLAAWCAVEGFATGRAAWWLGCGLLGGIAFWFRPEGLEPPLIVGMLIVCQCLLRKVSLVYGARGLTAVTCGMLAIVVPYIVLAGKFTSKQLPFAKKDSAPLFVVTETAAELRQMAKAELATPAPAPEAIADALSAEEGPTAVEAVAPSDNQVVDQAIVEHTPSPAADAGGEPSAESNSAEDQTAPSPAATAQIANDAHDQTSKPAEAPSASVSTPPVVAAAAPPPSVKPVVTWRVCFRLAGKAFFTFIKNMVWGLRFALVPMYLLGNWEMIRRGVPWWSIAMPAGMGCLHIAVLFGVYFLSGYIDQRHVMPVVAMTTPFAALGILYVAELIRRYVPQRFEQNYALAVVVLLCCGTIAPRAFTPMNSELQPVFFATSWIRAISNTDYVGFYAETPSVHLKNNMATVEAAILEGPPNVRYRFAVLDLNIYGCRPEWRAQLDRDFREVMRLEDPRSRSDEPKLLVYIARDKDGIAAGGTPVARDSASEPHVSALPAGKR